MSVRVHFLETIRFSYSYWEILLSIRIKEFFFYIYCSLISKLLFIPIQGHTSSSISYFIKSEHEFQFLFLCPHNTRNIGTCLIFIIIHFFTWMLFHFNFPIRIKGRRRRKKRVIRIIIWHLTLSYHASYVTDSRSLCFVHIRHSGPLSRITEGISIPEPCSLGLCSVVRNTKCETLENFN